MKNSYFLVLTFFVFHVSTANEIAVSYNLNVPDMTMPTLSNLILFDNNNDGFSVFDLSVQNAPTLAPPSITATQCKLNFLFFRKVMLSYVFSIFKIHLNIDLDLEYH